MDESRPATPEAPPQDLWLSILDSVASTRQIPSKQVLLLGQPSSGKSAIASALLNRAASDDASAEESTDFALGYEWANVRDDADEDTVARLSVYTVPSVATSYTALIPHFLPPRTALPHTLVMILLDWTRPWTFMDELQTWLKWVENWMKGDGSRELEIVREENRERLQLHIQHYNEPTSEPLPATSNISSDTILPLGSGVLTHNSAGVPIIVVCTKADLIDENSGLAGTGSSSMGGMVKGKGGEWEERTDGVMQVLRTICLKYGASLFYTTLQPSAVQVLRQYTLHLLFTPPAPTLNLLSGTDGPALVRNPFPFNHKANTLDRDRIVVPAGWDSWGKIGILRERFDPKAWGEAWERDISPDGAEGENQPGARQMYSQFVPDQAAKPAQLPPFNNPTPEQAFLSKHYDENSKKPDRDPRGAFRNPGESTSAGLVGPLGSTSFNLPNVERALTEMEAGVGGSTLNASASGDVARRLSTSVRSSSRPATMGLSVGGTTTASSSTQFVRSPTTPSLTSSPSPAGTQTQHEVLQNFFQSLLSSKDRPGGTASKSNTPKTNGAPSSTEDAS